MKITNTFKMLSLAASMALGLSLGAQAPAATISITDTGAANFGSGSVGYGGSGWLAPDPDSRTNPADVLIGGDSFSTANKSFFFSKTGQFNAWCVDIYHWMINSATYNVENGSNLAADLHAIDPSGPSGASRVAKLITLSDEVYSSVKTAETSAAFQLAVWEIAFGTPGNSGIYQIDSTDPTFNVDSNVVNSSYGKLANSWLDNLGKMPVTGNYALTYLSDGNTESTQDVIVLTPVPEPSSIALFAAGLAVFGFVLRKKA